MKWFKHFSNAHDNNDLTKVRMKFGAEGYAVYWYCLELIASDLGTDENINFELKHDAEVIGFNLKVDSIRVEEIMRFMVTLGLFEQCRSTITCLKLAKYLDKKTTRNSTIHKIVEAAHLSGTNPDSPGTLPDKSGRSALDTDTDTDTDTDKVKTKTVSSKKPPAAIELPAWVDRESWSKWEQHLKQLRKPLTPRAREAQLEFLCENQDTHKEIIMQSICGNWRGLFPLKNGGTHATHQHDKRSRAQKVSDKLDEIARRDIAQNGFTNNLD